MASQREHERRIWDAVLLYMTAATSSELLAPLGNVDINAWSDAEWERFAKAYERVESAIDRRATHRKR